MNSLLFQALQGNNQGRPPVWLMRQAGRYMPSYQALRKEHSLGSLFRTPQFIREVTLLPIHELGVDAAIIFSDILLLFETLDNVVHYPDKGAPWIESKQIELFNLETAISNLSRLNYLFEGIEITKKDLSVPLIGFSGAPFTLLCYLLDTDDRKTFPKTFHLLKENPVLFKSLLDLLSDLIIHYAKRQIKAGVDLFQVFESSGFILSREKCLEFSIPYLEKISKALEVPCISFMKGSCKNIEALKNSSLSYLSFDCELPMKTIRTALGKTPVLQGNLDPELLFKEEKIIEEQTLLLLTSMKEDPRFILNLGHGILPGTPYAHVQKFVKTALQF